ncbi:MAG: hypothetical protein AB7R55_14690 [Gemmatimonadales bacterium]
MGAVGIRGWIEEHYPGRGGVGRLWQDLMDVMHEKALEPPSESQVYRWAAGESEPRGAHLAGLRHLGYQRDPSYRSQIIERAVALGHSRELLESAYPADLQDLLDERLLAVVLETAAIVRERGGTFADVRTGTEMAVVAAPVLVSQPVSQPRQTDSRP